MVWKRSLLTVFLALQLCGVAAVPVDGEKGGNITLKCGLKTGVNLSVRLTHGPIIAYGYLQDNQYKGRVHSSGLCDLTLEDLKTNDAGMYKMGIYGNGDPVFLSYEVLVSDTLTGLKGEKLSFELPRDAESVQHCTDTGWTEVWKRGKGVLSDRLTDTDGHLVIGDFGSKDTGEYRFLNKTGGILITLTVKESGTESKGNLNSTNDHAHVDTEQQQPVRVWIVAPVASVALVALVMIVVAVFKKSKSDPMTPTSDQDQEMRFLPGGPSVISCSGVQIT